MKVGIISLYYQNYNYGGALQSFALTKYLRNNGYDAEQICYSCSNPKAFSREFWKLGGVEKAKNIFRMLIRTVRSIRYTFVKTGKSYRNILDRQKKIDEFNSKRTPHSQRVWHYWNFSDVADKYDAFITGSDQVWNTDFAGHPAHFLSGINNEKLKFSYAASIGKEKCNKFDMAMTRGYLKGFSSVSVREEDSVNILKKAYNGTVEWVVDPTLLLSRSEWNDISANRVINHPYVFCYFIGRDLQERELAKEYAREKGLKIVTMPFLLKNSIFHQDFRSYESQFGDERLYDVSPEQFLSLIKYADYVFTDSFHAAIFSGVFQREYFIFGRGEMGSRITSLMRLYETPERYCAKAEQLNLQYLLSQAPIDYSHDLKLIKDMQQKSKDFLKTNLEKAER